MQANHITLDVMTAWLSLINIPYTVVDKELPMQGMVEIEVPANEAVALIELGRKLEQNKSRLKN